MPSIAEIRQCAPPKIEEKILMLDHRDFDLAKRYTKMIYKDLKNRG